MDSPDTNSMIAVIIRNSRGEFFVHQRAANKKMFPNLYGPGCGGHIRQGETPAQAARRELHEETGIEARPTSRSPPRNVNGNGGAGRHGTSSSNCWPRAKSCPTRPNFCRAT